VPTINEIIQKCPCEFQKSTTNHSLVKWHYKQTHNEEVNNFKFSERKKMKTRFFKTTILSLMTLASLFIMSNRLSAVSPPGVVVSHFPQSSGIYIGSPGLCILPDGTYLASHDEFGPKSTEMTGGPGRTRIFRSNDKGETWKQIAVIDGQYWSSMFLHKETLYHLGCDKVFGNIVIRKSSDNGVTWSTPTDSSNGVLFEGTYDTGPMSVLVHKGRIWRGVAHMDKALNETGGWGKGYAPMVISAPVDADLLKAESWKKTNYLPYNSAYLNGQFQCWLEVNMVVSPQGELCGISRVNTFPGNGEQVAFIKISPDGEKISFDPQTGFVKFPGATKKFSIHYDEKSQRYWTISNEIAPEFQMEILGSIRNRQALSCSKDLKTWEKCQVVLEHPDHLTHGFQYIEFTFDGDDIIFVSRTAFDDEENGAHQAHDANYLTFHRIKNFRDLKKD